MLLFRKSRLDRVLTRLQPGSNVGRNAVANVELTGGQLVEQCACGPTLRILERPVEISRLRLPDCHPMEMTCVVREEAGTCFLAAADLRPQLLYEPNRLRKVG